MPKKKKNRKKHRPESGKILPKGYNTRFKMFEDLMPYRVKDILIVSSLYDSYILEEDGRLRDLIATEYQSLRLPFAPNVERVSTGEMALKELENRNYDLVITMMRLGDMDASDLAGHIKERFEDLPVILLAYNTRELTSILSFGVSKAIDNVFVWHGDGKILLAIVKYIEDKKNSNHDILLGGVPAIILVEDSVDFYSSYLPMIYSELVTQIRHVLKSESILTRRYLRTRARPKVLLANTFEEGMELYERFKRNLIGVISDIRFPKNGQVDPDAGLKFARKIRTENPDLPILLQSNEAEHVHDANELNIAFLRKRNRSLLRDLSNFIKHNFGFGDFVFYLPNGDQVGRAPDLYSMEQVLKDIPPESIKWHAERDHFSRWLMARTEFELARILADYDVSDFESIETVRKFLLDSLANLCREAHAGVVTKYSAKQCHEHCRFIRIGDGSLGGKGRGLAFIHGLFDRYDIRERFENVVIAVPRTAVIASDIFDDFIDYNNLRPLAISDVDDDEIIEAFLDSESGLNIPDILEHFKDTPIAVRSSSLLEDTHFQPFAGTYATLMLANDDPDPQIRLQQLKQAIKYVYASTYFKRAKQYIDATPNRIEEEKMAVIIQEVVGTSHDNYFYPSFAGVARSYNFYPMGEQMPDDGVAQVVLGLGNTVVEGGVSLRFSPVHPHILPQFTDVKNVLKNSQTTLSVLDKKVSFLPIEVNKSPNLINVGLDFADKHDTLWPVGSTYSVENDAIYDGINRPGVRLVTFAHILKSEIFPLAKILDQLLNMGEISMGCPIEIEFAVNLDKKKGEPKEFGFLQIRPLVVGQESEDTEIKNIDRKRIICSCARTLGHGLKREIQDIIYIKPDKFDSGKTIRIAEQVTKFNTKLKEADRNYMLIGPGRWGTSDRWLGIPVIWSQISNAQVIVEVSLKDFVVDPSQGSHFFQNITAFNVGYFALDIQSKDDMVDWDWICAQPISDEDEYVAHVILDKNLEVRIDGRSSHGVVLKPQ